MTAGGRPLASAVRGLVIGLLALGAAALAWFAAQRNLDRACELNEWPYFSSCPKVDASPSAQVQSLRQRAARNPGDATTFLALALLTTQPGGIAPLDEEAVFAVARQLAGQDPTLRRVLASRAIQRGQWEQAVSLLAGLVEDHRDAEAAKQLALLFAVPEARDAMMAALQPGIHWLEPVLRAMPAVNVSVQQAMPLLAQALSMKLLSADMGLSLVSYLRAKGAWLDAQAMWLRLLGRPATLIFNGGFEEGFIRGGFDWEIPDLTAQQAGVQLQQPTVPGANGRALELFFNGRPLKVPVLSQYLVLQPGHFEFSGRFMGKGLRAGDGLIWTFSCTSSTTELARTAGLTNTDGRWKALALTLDVPSGCGAVWMQLRTQLASDALKGLRGEAYFDDLRLFMR
jgi:hypothetical protein